MVSELLLKHRNQKECEFKPHHDCQFICFCHFAAGQYYNSQKIIWGDWSVESQYVTFGQAAVPAQAAPAAAAGAAAASRKKDRKKGPEKKSVEKKMSSAAAQQAAVDEQNAIEQLKVTHRVTH